LLFFFCVCSIFQFNGSVLIDKKNGSNVKLQIIWRMRPTTRFKSALNQLALANLTEHTHYTHIQFTCELRNQIDENISEIDPHAVSMQKPSTFPCFSLMDSVCSQFNVSFAF